MSTTHISMHPVLRHEAEISKTLYGSHTIEDILENLGNVLDVIPRFSINWSGLGAPKLRRLEDPQEAMMLDVAV